MNKKQIILLIILSLLLVGLSYLNINKYLLNSNSSKTAETKDDEYHQALNNMKNLKNVSISIFVCDNDGKSFKAKNITILNIKNDS